MTLSGTASLIATLGSTGGTLIGGAANETLQGGSGTNVLFAGYGSDVLQGNSSATTTFVLGDAPASTVPHSVTNFNIAHDTLDLPGATYGFNSLITSGAGENVFVLANDAAAAAYTGAGNAILVVGGSSANTADVYFYQAHDPSYSNQAHAYQLANVMAPA